MRTTLASGDARRARRPLAGDGRRDLCGCYRRAMPRAASFAIVLCFSAASFAKGYAGPAHPTIPADAQAIDTSMAGCMKATLEVAGDDEAAARAPATRLCALRTQHKAARDRLLAGLANLVAEYKDDT